MLSIPSHPVALRPAAASVFRTFVGILFFVLAAGSAATGTPAAGTPVAGTKGLALDASLEVDRELPAKARGHVEIRTSAGEIRIVGEARSSVRVQGTVGPGVERFEVFEEGRYLRFVAHPPPVPREREQGPGPRSALTFRVPAGSEIDLSTVEAEVTVDGVEGRIRVVNGLGETTVTGSPRSVHGDSVSGDFAVDVTSPEVELKTVSGDVSVAGRVDHLVAETVDRPLRITAELGVEALLRTVTGEVSFRGATAPEARLRVESSSGPVSLELPADLEGSFLLESAGGTLENDLGPPWTEEGGKRTVRWRRGDAPRRIEIQTFDGDIELRSP